MSHQILIVDDNRDLAEGLSELLDLEGYSSDIAYNVSDALNMLQANDYSYCLIDIKLPDGNGIDVFNYAKIRIPYSNIIPLTGFRLEQCVNDIFHCSGQSLFNLDSDQTSLSNALSKDKKCPVKLIVVDKTKHLLNASDIETMVVEDYHYITSLPDDVMVSAIPNKPLYIIDLDEPAIKSIWLAYELRKINPDCRVVITIQPFDTDGDPANSFRTTGMLFKPFKTDFFLSVIENTFKLASS